MDKFIPVETEAKIQALGLKTSFGLIYLHNKWLSYTLNQLKHLHESETSVETLHNPHLLAIKLATYQTTGA